MSEEGARFGSGEGEAEKDGGGGERIALSLRTAEAVKKVNGIVAEFVASGGAGDEEFRKWLKSPRVKEILDEFMNVSDAIDAQWAATRDASRAIDAQYKELLAQLEASNAAREV